MIARRSRSNISYSRKQDRGVALGGSSVAELAISIVAPGHHGSVAPYRNGVILPRSDGHNVCHHNGLHGCQSLSCRSIAELAVSVVAPVPNGPVSL